jgi:hypothetical protein
MQMFHPFLTEQQCGMNIQGLKRQTTDERFEVLMVMPMKITVA